MKPTEDHQRLSLLLNDKKSIFDHLLPIKMKLRHSMLRFNPEMIDSIEMLKQSQAELLHTFAVP